MAENKIAYDTITVDTHRQVRPLRRSDRMSCMLIDPVQLGKQARFGAAGSGSAPGSAKYRDRGSMGWCQKGGSSCPPRPCGTASAGSAAGTLATYSRPYRRYANCNKKIRRSAGEDSASIGLPSSDNAEVDIADH